MKYSNKSLFIYLSKLFYFRKSDQLNERCLAVSDRLTLERIIKFMFDSIGSYLSIRKIANTLTSMGHKITPNTVDRYINALLDSLIIYDVSRFDIHGKEQLGSLKNITLLILGLDIICWQIKKKIVDI